MSGETVRHTPGPWGFHKDQQEHDVVYAENGDGVAVALLGTTYFPRSTWEANARLIAAAPEMYEALKRIQQEHRLDVIDAICERAIAKAEGRT